MQYIIIIIVAFGLIPLGIAWFIGRHKRIGFWKSLLVSVIFTPFVGFFITNNSPTRYPIGCKWCGNVDNEAEYCGLCGKSWDGSVKPGYAERQEE